MNTISTTRRTLAIAAIGAGALATGCSDSSTPTSAQAPQSQAQTTERDQGMGRADVYPGLLGEITEVPAQGDPSKSLKIHHAAIPDFKTKDGVVNVSPDGLRGMKSMTMAFPVADGLDISDLRIGDKVRFTFRVNWNGSQTAWEVTEIEKIDPDTEIDFSNPTSDDMNGTDDGMDDGMDDTNDPTGNDGP